ncbi:MAG TPA: DUF2946 family protein [Pyrinomonadaceae bacterium]|jgi:hypothetical protein|nr:DUF2946 family protein [Pyrinomonadaceae bacterium]
MRGPRLIAAVLLAAIAWGGTVEFTHNHGVRAATTAEGKTSQATLSQDRADVRVLTSDESEQSSSRSKPGTECLICQLHHNLATTVLTQWAGAVTTEAQLSNFQPATSIHLFEFTATQQGRAPPLFSLS